MKRALLLLPVLAIAACWDRSEPVRRQEEPPPVTAACTGAAPDHAVPCPGSEAWPPAVETPRYLTISCAAQPCSFGCAAGYGWSAGACVSGTPPPPATATLVDAGDGTLRDVATGLRWLRSPACAEPLGGVERPGGYVGFLAARDWMARLGAGACGLSDGSGPGDWGFPSEQELLALVGSGAAFLAAPGGPAWSSLEPCSTTAITIDPATGAVGEHPKGDALAAWPVRRPR
ncbi:MAG: hypothetical protein QM704_08080 [Anaeromyxobacteraceae bacterium]